MDTEATSREAHALKKFDKRIEQQSWLSTFSKADITAAQESDAGIAKVRNWVQDDHKPTTAELEVESAEVKTIVGRWRLLSLKDNVLIRTVQTAQKTVLKQVILPSSLRLDVLHQLHDLRVTGHIGIQRTVARVKRRFYWPRLALDLARWCANCEHCAGRKGKPRPVRQPMQTFDVGAPLERISIDILDTHKVMRQQNRYVLVVSDYFTKWTDAFPLRKHTARA